MSKESSSKVWEAYRPLIALVLVLEIGGTPLLIFIFSVIARLTQDPECLDGAFFENNIAHACNSNQGSVVSSRQEGFHLLDGSIALEEITTRGTQGQFLFVEEELNDRVITRIFYNGTYLASLPSGLDARNVYFIDQDAVEYYDRRGRFTICFRYEFQSGIAVQVRDFTNIQHVAASH